MKRLFATLRCDMLVLFRNGFFYISALFTLVWVALIQQIPRTNLLDASLLVPAMLLQHFVITTFYFIAALALLEKAEGTLSGLVVTPLRPAEYLFSKALTLTLAAALESLAIVIAAYGLSFRAAPLLAGMLALGGCYTLVGFVAVARFHSINEYLLPSVVLVSMLLLPLLGHFGIWRSPLLLLHPVQPMLLLLRAAFAPVSAGELAYGLSGSLAWLGVSFVWARSVFTRFVVRAT